MTTRSYQIVFMDDDTPNETVEATRFWVEGSFLLFIDEEYSNQPTTAFSAGAVFSVTEVSPS